MGANVGNQKGAMAGINITPLVDVVLVLLIIFMLLIREDATYIPNTIPQKPKVETEDIIDLEQLVLELHADSSVFLNRNPMTKEDFPEYFRKVMDERTDKKLFVSAEDTVMYKEVVYWMSMARSSGASLVALQIRPPDSIDESNTPKTEPAQNPSSSSKPK